MNVPLFFDMEIRNTHRDDLEEILEIYESARQYMVNHGNPNQWGNGYPDEKILLADIATRNHFVCTDGNRILGCFAFFEGDDPTYKEIFKGKWLNDHPYAVIHRIAVLHHGKGIGSICMDWCFKQRSNIRADTHRDNLPMQRLLIKKGFRCVGVIRNRWGDERLAFQSEL